MEQNNTKQTTTVGSFLNWATNNLSLFSFSIAALGIVVAFYFLLFNADKLYA